MIQRRYAISRFSLVALCSSAFIVWGCGPKSAHDLHSAAAGKKYGGTYNINMIRGNPNGLDPVIINSKLADDIAAQIFDQLISLDSSLGLVPELATRWELSPDGTTYTFHLRNDVSFQDDPCFADGKGRKFTARDVVYSFERACDPRTRTVAYWVFQDKVEGANAFFETRADSIKGNEVEHVSGVRAPDDTTFQIVLTRPYAPFIYYLVESCCDIVPHEAVEKYGKDFFQHPVGTGAFAFDHWRPDDEMLLKRNPHYWQKDAAGNQLPLLDGILFKFIKDDKTQFNEFTQGTFDECTPLPTEFFERIVDTATKKTTAEYSKFKLQATPALCTWFVNFLTTKAPFDNVNVRRAFSCAVDRDKIVRFVLKGQPFAPGTHGIVPPAFPKYPIDSVHGYHYDPEQARKYLSDAGYPDGKNFPEIKLHVYPDPRLLQVAEAVQNMLSSTLHITINLQVMQFAQLMDNAEAGSLNIWGTRWYGDYPDPENFLNLWYGALVPVTDAVPSYPNDTRYNGAVFNAEFGRALRLANDGERNNAYVTAENAAMADAPSIILFYEEHYRLLQPTVRDTPLDPMARVDLKWTWFSE